jgi:hypothetical protein
MACGCQRRREKLAQANKRVARWLAKKLGTYREPTPTDQPEATGGNSEPEQPEPSHSAEA